MLHQHKLRLFFQAISWNIINLFLYKIILQTHQYFLFLTISREMFGLAGSIFSTIYFAISVTNFGFDYFLISYFNQYTQTKDALGKLKGLLALRLSFLGFLSVALLCCATYVAGSNHIAHWISLQPCSLHILFLIIFIVESFKKSLDIVAQMAFMQRSVTMLDISSLLMYVTWVWSSYLLWGYISLYTIFVPMSVASIVEAFLLSRRIYHHYQVAPATHEAQVVPLLAPATHEAQVVPLPSRNTIIRQLAVNYINQISKALFSPNFLIMLLACKLGVSKAGYIKLYTDMIILMYMLLNRSFGLPSAALLSALSQKYHDNITFLKAQFIKILDWYLQFLLIAGTAITWWLFFIVHRNAQADVWIYVTLFILIALIEYVVILYEKWYLTQHKASTLALINASSTVLCLVTLYFWPASLGSLILLPLLALRFGFLVTIMCVTYKLWHIQPTWRTLLRSMVPTAIGSIIMLSILCI